MSGFLAPILKQLSHPLQILGSIQVLGTNFLNKPAILLKAPLNLRIALSAVEIDDQTYR